VRFPKPFSEIISRKISLQKFIGRHIARFLQVPSNSWLCNDHIFDIFSFPYSCSPSEDAYLAGSGTIIFAWRSVFLVIPCLKMILLLFSWDCFAHELGIFYLWLSRTNRKPISTCPLILEFEGNYPTIVYVSFLFF
jgi:hypothetical protein